MHFQVHTIETAPQSSRQALEAIETRYGFVPNLAAVFAESPGAFKGLLAALKSYDDDALTLTPLERQIVMLAAAVENRCDYCTAAHSMLAHSMGLSRADIDALQRGAPIGDPKLEALRAFTRAVVAERGAVDEAGVRGFIGAGFTAGQVLEVVLGVSIKTLTNYASHLANPPINDQFKAFLPDDAMAV